MGMKVRGTIFEKQTWNAMKSANTSHDVAVQSTDGTHYGLIVHDIPAGVVLTGTDTWTGAGLVEPLYYNSSLACRNLHLSCPSGFYLIKSGQTAGCKYQANVVYDIPIANLNKIWVSGTTANQTFYWSAFG